MAPLTNDSDRDWERFGQTDPYYAVLSSPRYRGRLSATDRAEFFRSGEAHLERIYFTSPLMQDNHYSVTRLLDLLRRQGCTEVYVRFSDQQGNRGVLLFGRKGPADVFT